MEYYGEIFSPVKRYYVASAVTKNTPVKYTAGGIAPSTAATDDIVGVALESISAGSYCPVLGDGGRIRVTSGDAILDAARVTATTSSKVITVTKTAECVQLGFALEAASAADKEILIEIKIEKYKI